VLHVLLATLLVFCSNLVDACSNERMVLAGIEAINDIWDKEWLS